MSRDILFEAKQRFWKEDEDENCWAEGLYQQIGSRGNVEHYITENLMIKSGLQCFYTEIDPETLCQCTGVSDINCVKIYEHDIVMFFGMIGEVVFEAGAFGIAVKKGIDWETIERNVRPSETPYFTHDDNFISLWEIMRNFDGEYCNVIEVIGNKFYNPELLEPVEETI